MENTRRYEYSQPAYKSEVESFRELDMYRKQLVVEALRRTPAVYDSDIDIALIDNKIFIRGSVPNAEVRDAVESVVIHNFRGEHVKNELSVRPSRSYFGT